MASKTKSRWADDEKESAEIIAQRKREKEEKKRAKEEKLHKAAAAQVQLAQQPDQEPTKINGEPERPIKRRKTSPEPEEEEVVENDRETKLLKFPSTRFGSCRDVDLYERLNDIEEGSYGMVSRAREKATGDIVALKRLKMDYANDGFPVTGLREIQTLMASHHINIVKLREVVMGTTLKE